ncbi:MAG: alpha/beta fold hydrolase [Pseudomonadota bacterium]
MHLFLVHSPLLTPSVWDRLMESLEAANVSATAVALDNAAPPSTKHFEHHLAQLQDALLDLRRAPLVGIAHSGAGSLLALLDPQQFAGLIYLDAIFPDKGASRFELFDDPRAVNVWRQAAEQNGGKLPRSMLLQLAAAVQGERSRKALKAGIADVPVALYEEVIPVHPRWPAVERGLYLQWTDSYAADADRAQSAGFEVRRQAASHFEMLNQPDAVAETLLAFSRTLE